MQRIERKNKNTVKLFDEIDRFYQYTSTIAHVNSLIPQVFDTSFNTLIEEFNTRASTNYAPTLIEREYEQIEPIHNNNIIVCFSGGKDSVACAMKYKEAGYNVYLYHMKHINASLSDEWKFAEECAKLLDAPLYIDDVKLLGHHDWMEHPMKNMIIACGAIEYGLREHITTDIAFGNYTSSVLDDNVFDRCAGDCMDMWDSFNVIVQRVIPDFKMHANLESMGETLQIVTPNTQMLNNSVSCLCRHSLRDYRHQWVKDKFNIDLPKNRCGSCYKCCVEYIYMADHDLIEFSADYYRYCFNQLYKVANAEDTIVFTALGVWDSYFLYPVTESKLYQDIMDARLFGKNIKWKGLKIISK